MAALLIQTALDGLLFALCALGVFGRKRGKADLAFPLLYIGLCLVTRLLFDESPGGLAFTVVPAIRLIPVLFLFLAALLLNSAWFHGTEGQTFFGTVALFALYLLLRELCLVGLSLCGLREDFWYLYGGRLLSLLLWLGLWASGGLKWLRERLADGDRWVCMVCCNAAVILLLLLVVFQFNLSSMFRRLPLTAGMLLALVLGNGIVIFADQRRIQSQRKSQLLEQYLPLVEELVEQVRGRQHEFKNQMMAISAALETAADLQEAKEAVAPLLQRMKLAPADRELLKCDSKVMSGMLFGKIRQAELRHIQIDVVISSAFLRRPIPEADWVEAAGILIDNALEASSPGDMVYVRAEDLDGSFRFTVSNPHAALSNVEFVQMFRPGWSTKAPSGRGYGLSNLRRIVERHGGKIISRNDTFDGTPYITMGILI